MRKGFFADRILTDKERKNFDVLDTIRKHSRVSRSDISKITDYNIVTVSNYVDAFIKMGLIEEKGLDISTGGRRPELVELKRDFAYAIGIDLGPMSAPAVVMRAVITDLSGDIIAEVDKIREKKPIDEVLGMSFELIDKVLEKGGVDKEKIKGIGIGVSGAISTLVGTIRDISVGGMVANYDSIRCEIEKHAGIETYCGSDSTLAAFGEKMLGAGQDAENMLYMYADVGCGIIIRGQIYCGITGSAGELGLIEREEEEFGCWVQKGCLLKRRGLDLGMVEKARKILEEGVTDSGMLKSVEGDLDKITLEVITKSAHKNDKLAKDLIENAGVEFGIKIAYLVNLFNPEMVIIGGGIESAGTILTEPLKRTVKRWTFEEASNEVRVVPSSLGKRAVALGAASMVMKNYFVSL